MRSAPFLVQRMSFRENPPENPSFDQLLSMDYMGSAEFEFGALPESLKRICRQHPHYVTMSYPGHTDHAGAPLSVVTRTGGCAACAGYVLEIMRGTGPKTKEPTYLDIHATGTWMGKPLPPDCHFLSVNAWWDIENDTLWTFGEDNARRILAAIETTRKNKIAQGKTGWS